MKCIKKLFLFLCIFSIISFYTPLFSIGAGCLNVSAASKTKLSKTKATITTGKTLQLKLNGSNKKISWTSSKKSIATVTKKGKVTAKKAGKTTITAKVNGKKYLCNVTVKNQEIKCTYKSKLTLQGTIKKKKNLFTGETIYILSLDYPIKIKYTEDNIQISKTYSEFDLSLTKSQSKKFFNKHVKISGSIIYGMTAHYINDFAVFDVKCQNIK